MEVRQEPMRNVYSYESMLSAVGRVLDDAGIKRVAIQDTGDGLVVEGFDTAGQTQVTLRYDVPALVALLESGSVVSSGRMTSNDEGTLRHFLAQHQQLVGAR